jgi:phenylpropionate dioxygenase-like ring-hydroxylating dioxygenase large terminal subunit
VHNPHGDHTIPKACRVRSYPLVERHGILWLWAGVPERADPATIPDFGYLVEKGRKTIYGGASLKANYELITDNLMDASHTQYVHSVNFRWQPPGLVRNSVSLTPVGRPPDDAIHRIGTHLMTPETATTTHYFFSHTRNFQLDDLRVDERTRRWQKSGLTDQDGPMIEACQETMGTTTDLMSLRPVLLSIDAAAVRVRLVLAKLIEEESSQRQ